MTELVLDQRSRLGRKLLVLDGDRLKVTGRRGMQRFECNFDLRDVAPHFERVRGRYLRLVTIPLAFASITALAIRAIVVGTTLPYEFAVIPGAMIIAVFLWQAAKGFSSLEIIQFHSRKGGVVFDVIKEKNQAEECEHFVAEICARIQGQGSIREASPQGQT